MVRIDMKPIMLTSSHDAIPNSWTLTPIDATVVVLMPNAAAFVEAISLYTPAQNKW